MTITIKDKTKEQSFLKFDLLPEDLQISVLKFVSDQPQIRRISKAIRANFNIYETLAEKYQTIRSIYVSLTDRPYSFLGYVKTAYDLVINAAQHNPDKELLALKKGESLISPYRIQRIADLQAAFNMRVFLKRLQIKSRKPERF